MYRLVIEQTIRIYEWGSQQHAFATASFRRLVTRGRMDLHFANSSCRLDLTNRTCKPRMTCSKNGKSSFSKSSKQLLTVEGKINEEDLELEESLPNLVFLKSQK
jgi:hypothetical protein